MLLRPYNPALDVDVFPRLSIVDWGDLELTPGNAERTTGQIGDGLGSLLAADVVPILLGGDHSVTLGALRAQAAKHGPVAVALLDAHADTWDQYYGERYFHGTVFRRAAEEGVVAPERSLLAGIRGSLYSEDDLTSARELGFELITCTELGGMTVEDYGRRVRERIGDGPAYFSFDIDVVDPAFAPATGTPEVGGLTGREALAFIRSLAGMRFGGFDVVEVSPPYDGPGQTTALLAANVAYEFLSLTALAR
jgi:agmatinase